jgi:hypothetical protein
MRPGEAPQGPRSPLKKSDLGDLAIRVLLAACLWLSMHLLQISEAVAIVSIAAIFGPGVLRRDR